VNGGGTSPQPPYGHMSARGVTVAGQQVPVLVAGGSLVGLSTSLLLATAGVPHLLIERHRGTAVHPRAASFHQRTVEIFRTLGVQAAVEAAAEREFVQNGAIVSVPSLSSDQVTYFFRNFNEGVEQLSPTARLFITQIGLEPLLRDTAQERGATHRYATELVDFEQDDDGVTAVMRSRDGGAEETVRSDYLVAADGAHSLVRERSGIEMTGRGAFARCVTIYFRADMRDLIGERNLSVVYVNHPELLGFFRFSFAGDAGFLAVFSTIEADGSRDTHVAEDLTPERCVDLVRKALGRPDLAVDVDNVQRWSAEASWAPRFQDRRVFLAGDAAHVMPPTGGFGGNTGVADAHNLAWKLALVANGTAGAALLDTYDAERRPVAGLTVEQAYTRYVLRVDPSLPRDDLAAPLDDASIELGPIYRSGAVLGPDEDDGAPLVDPRLPGGRPGTRAPHLPVDRDGAPASVLDVLGDGFVLLAGPTGQPWCDAAASAAADLGMPLTAYRVAPDGSLVDAGSSFPETFGTGADGAVLVRPDGVIGWRVTAAAENPREEVERAMRRLLFR
jgi:2-polyprenyl-6-methoxyphenol hydroxylase-like FAD-dependent oxidoreductase